MGKPNGGLQETYAGSLPRAKKTPISIRYRPGELYIRAGMGGRKKRCNDSERDGSINEQSQYRKQYTSTPQGTLSPATAMPAHPVPKPRCFESMPETTEANKAIMRYTSLLTPSPTVAIRLGLLSQIREREKTGMLAWIWVLNGQRRETKENQSMEEVRKIVQLYFIESGFLL